jgi:hypothetical protein
MDLLLELDLSLLPTPTGAAGLLQLWYCTRGEPNCEAETEAFQAGPGKSKLIRVLPAEGARAVALPADLGGRDGPARRVAAWEPMQDLPGTEEASELCHRGREELEELLEGLPREGDKLGGWPAWLQGVEYPPCPRCNQEMRQLLVQLASNGLSGWQWGDLGTAWVLRCADHPESVELIWQGA